jgi:hypothetical protein
VPTALKLTPDDAKELRLLRATMDLSYAALGEMFGIHESNAAKVCHGFTHPDAGGPIEPVGGPEKWTKRHRPEHGEQSRYQAGCRCDLCSETNRVHCAEWRRKKTWKLSRVSQRGSQGHASG